MSPQSATSVQFSAIGVQIEVRRLLSFILRRPIGDRENPSRSTEADWDSLKHIELMFLLEDHFGVRFSEQEMEQMEDADGILRRLEARHLRADHLEASHLKAEHAP
jgi:acyl carrier protein